MNEEGAMRDGLEQLKSVMLLLHEEEAAGDTVDWGVAATELGVPSFPSDYRDFVTSFGAGSIEDSVYVWVPRVDARVAGVGGRLQAPAGGHACLGADEQRGCSVLGGVRP
jgi:hypothetical protein